MRSQRLLGWNSPDPVKVYAAIKAVGSTIFIVVGTAFVSGGAASIGSKLVDRLMEDSPANTAAKTEINYNLTQSEIALADAKAASRAATEASTEANTKYTTSQYSRKAADDAVTLSKNALTLSNNAFTLSVREQQSAVEGLTQALMQKAEVEDL